MTNILWLLDCYHSGEAATVGLGLGSKTAWLHLGKDHNLDLKKLYSLFLSK